MLIDVHVQELLIELRPDFIATRHVVGLHNAYIHGHKYAAPRTILKYNYKNTGLSFYGPIKHCNKNCV